MQIGGTAPFTSDAATPTRDAGMASDQADYDGTLTSEDSADLAPSSSQDNAVSISPQGYDAASTDTDAGSDTGASSETPAEANAQPVKSLMYGALGLDRPDQPVDPNHAYTVGQWIAAGITLGGIISLFV
jgi:hypothetical protein